MSWRLDFLSLTKEDWDGAMAALAVVVVWETASFEEGLKGRGRRKCLLMGAMDLATSSSVVSSEWDWDESRLVLTEVAGPERARGSPLRILLWWSGCWPESMDAAPKVPHLRPTRRDAGRGVRCGCPRVGPGLRFFFFFSRIRADSARFAPMRLDSCRIGFDLRRTGLIRPKSGRIGHIRSYRLAADTAEIGRNMPEMVEIDLEYGRKIWNLHSSFFFCESRHSMCFLKIF